jgi:peptidoglycan/xylan/chitin deacetylase (PgdA/CDA1 family)
MARPRSEQRRRARIPTSSKVVALTFDTGANAAGRPAIESALRARNVRATFFLTGTWVHDFPAQANLIVQDGYLVGNHSVLSRSWSPATWSTCAPATSWWLTAWCGPARAWRLMSGC